ncbi:glutamyl-tRNA reductase [Clostridium sp. D2Q-11]|uniref:Glutamyl-tRNA reductase n=1 Tax=Anaeromonas frigoriresistens TaxID=2683708 RepID=A0A942UW37_9FIRM|nr:glutamyl-tRNA reductase [Anaeromonas frigoriresistens]MBS4537889.1 glutamyl-tRNA reductase [Anaeromonas frigoriresistens]
MKFAVIGLNHETAATSVREKVAFIDTRKIVAINILLDQGIDEVVILSTCNRSEIYIVEYKNKLDEKIDKIKDFYSKFFDINNVKDYLYVKKNKEAIIHLYNVASGLDSIVLGEDQILGQVKEAHEFAMDLGGSKKVLNKLFREAISISKKIKSELKISEHPISISYIGVKFLKKKLSTLKDKNALIIGLGKMGKLTLKYLLEENLNKIYMINRNHQKVIDLSKDYPNVIPIDYYDRYDILREVDILITSTSSPHVIIKANEMEEINSELNILDLAMPKDVDIKIKNHKSIHLYDIDDLKEISYENEKRRADISEEAIEIIQESIDEFMLWLKSIKADPVIEHLNNKSKKIKDETLDYIYKKVELDNRDKKIIDKMLNSALKRLIREPILKLKETDNEDILDEYINSLENLYDISRGD